MISRQHESSRSAAALQPRRQKWRGVLWPFAPMHLREVLAAGGATASDTLHLTLAGVTVVLMMVAMVSAATAFGARFRLFSAASLVVLFACGALTFAEAPKVAAILPTPWIGAWERINLGVFLVWVVVLSAALLRAPAVRARDAEALAA